MSVVNNSFLAGAMQSIELRVQKGAMQSAWMHAKDLAKVYAQKKVAEDMAKVETNLAMANYRAAYAVYDREKGKVKKGARNGK